MASDDEIARQVRQREHEGWLDPSGGPAHEDLQEYREMAGEIHDELARRIRDVDDRSASEDDLADLVEKLEALENRLDDIEDDL